MTNTVLTLEQHLVDQRRQAGVPDAEIATLLACVAEAATRLSWEIRRAALVGHVGFTGERNVTGDAQKKLEPLAFVVEQAGGAASTGGQRVLDVRAESIHQRVPFAIGSREDVALYERFAKAGAPA